MNIDHVYLLTKQFQAQQSGGRKKWNKKIDHNLQAIGNTYE